MPEIRAEPADGPVDRKANASPKSANSLGATLLTIAEPVLALLLSFLLTVSVMAFQTRSAPVMLGPNAYQIRLLPKNLVPPPVSVVPVVSESVFFANGSAALPKYAEFVGRFVGGITTCKNAKVQVIPWVSSLEYRNDPKGQRNLELAINRGKAVKQLLLQQRHDLDVDVTPWESFDAILLKLTFDDKRPSPDKESPQEALNRRVDIDVIRGCLK